MLRRALAAVLVVAGLTAFAPASANAGPVALTVVQRNCTNC